MPNPVPPFRGNVPNPRPPLYGSISNLQVVWGKFTARLNSDGGPGYGHTYYECNSCVLNNATIVTYWNPQFPPVVGTRFVIMNSVKPIQITGPLTLVDDDANGGNGLPKGFGLALEITPNEITMIVTDESAELPA